MMTVSRASRKTTRKTGTEKTLVGILVYVRSGGFCGCLDDGFFCL